MSEIDRIVDELHRAFAGPAWHGPALREVLANVTADIAAAHPIRQAHSIWEIVLHLTAWRPVIARRLRGETISLTGTTDWPHIEKFTTPAWQQAVRRLEEAQGQLINEARRLADSRLAEQVAGKDYDVLFMLHGMAQHDAYHAGQIALLKKGE